MLNEKTDLAKIYEWRNRDTMKNTTVSYYAKERKTRIENLEKIVGCKLKEKYAAQALTCSAYANEYNSNKQGKTIFNQDVLATVGDAILKAILTIELCKEDYSISKDVQLSMFHIN